MSGLKWWKIVLIIFIIIFVIRTGEHYYDPGDACGIHVFDVNESVARNGTVIHLTEQDFKEHPVLVEVIKGEKPLSRMLRRDGVLTDRKEAKYLCDRFMGNITEEKYVEYEGKYYELRLYIR
ncbi:MAG: hypothetical protein J7J06_05095 [Methanosarcinales archaeon]|nr:hypothetical protein [Methanosarcinales archaeon]